MRNPAADITADKITQASRALQYAEDMLFRAVELTVADGQAGRLPAPQAFDLSDIYIQKVNLIRQAAAILRDAARLVAPPSTKEVPSDTRPGVYYTLTQYHDTGNVTCTCPCFVHRSRCKHQARW